MFEVDGSIDTGVRGRRATLDPDTGRYDHAAPQGVDLRVMSLLNPLNSGLQWWNGTKKGENQVKDLP